VKTKPLHYPIYLITLDEHYDSFMLQETASVVWWSVPCYRSRGPGSIPGASRFSEK
jgi:hypothetical protein